MAGWNVDLFFRINWSLNRDACMGGATGKHHGNKRTRDWMERKAQLGHKLIPE